ncbi:hypothetical protein QYE76_006499 [Lolium multiflorum]|uniref:SIAH-type domain-containing protein n=1 Tax=Lolium multiflorum TaxID=4521 RepID=A0AAD8RVY2_LOLMU|nr:hypothetical protein QYE76_006499 [Lolium multiflorum]
MVKCVGCQSLVASTESYKHYIACPHGPCGCTEAINTGCSFTGPPRELLVHLQASHSIPVFTFQYGIPAWCIVRVPVQPRGHLFIGSGEEDGSMFAITVGALGPTTIVSCVCIRSAACLFPMYKAQLVIGPPAPATAGTSDLSTDTLMAVIEPTSSPTPSSIMLQQLTSFLAVPPRYAKQNGGQRVLPICVCINKKPFGLPCVLCCDPADKPWVFKEDLPVHSKCKLVPLDRFSYDGLMPHGKDEERAGANGDWIAMVGPEGKWNLLNVYTHRKIKLPSLRKKFETTRNPLIFEYQRSAIQLQKIAICQVPTAARGYKDFSLVAIFDFAIAYLHGEYPRTWIFLENQFQYGAIYCDAIIHNGLVFAVTELGNMDGGERAKKPILSEMTSHSVTSDIPDDKMDVGEGTKKRMLCEITSKSVCSDIPDDKKHRVEENSILSDNKGEMASQSFKPPTPPCLLSMEIDAAGPGTDEPIPGIIMPHEEGCGLGLPPAVETGGAAGAASVEPLVNGVMPISELEQNGLPIVKTDVDAGVATDDPAPEGGFVLVEPVMTMPTLTGGGPGAGRTGGLPGAGIVEISANGAVPPDSYELEHVPDVPSVEPDAPISSGDDSAESDQEGSASLGQDVSCHSPTSS